MSNPLAYDGIERGSEDRLMRRQGTGSGAQTGGGSEPVGSHGKSNDMYQIFREKALKMSGFAFHLINGSRGIGNTRGSGCWRKGQRQEKAERKRTKETAATLLICFSLF